jgi:ketosteroid isomerase-like protein
MIRTLSTLFAIIVLCTTPVLADDAADVRASIERHYTAIHAQNTGAVTDHHLEDFTMFFSDGGVLWESGWAEASERMGGTVDFPVINVRMSNFNAQVYDSVAIATFYLIGTSGEGDDSRKITNRVSAVWVKTGGEWKEAHHHESPLWPYGHH